MSNFAKKAWGGGGSSDAYAHNITCMYTVSMCRLQKITIILLPLNKYSYQMKMII